MLEKCNEYNVDLHHLYVDFKQAYNVNRNELLKIMDTLGVPKKLVRLTRMTLTDDSGERFIMAIP